MQVSLAGLFDRFRLRPQHVVLALLSLLLVGLAAATYPWRIDNDLAWNLYVARLVDQHGFVLYRDIYVIDSLGTVFFSVVIGRLVGYTNDFGMRLVDLALLASLLALTWAWLRRAGGLAAWCGAVLFGIIYLESGAFVSLQKEYLMLLPLVGAALIATSLPRLDDRLRGFLIGLLFGIVVTIKPHGALSLPVVLAAMLLEIRDREGGLTLRRAILLLACAAAGMLPPILAMLGYLLANGALTPYLDILANYGALYGQTTYNLTVVSGPERLDYLYSTLATLNGRQAWLLPAVVGVMAAFLPGSPKTLRRHAGLSLALTGCYLAYPALTGQFFLYHWLPFVYFLLATSALCLAPAREGTNLWMRAVPLASIALALLLHYDMVTRGFNLVYARFVNGYMPIPPQMGRADQIADYGRANFAPGDTAQPLDWGNGAMLALLMTDTPPANRFVFDTPFVYDAAGAYVQGLRREYIDGLRGGHAPDWIVYVSDQPILLGPGIDYRWPELQETLDTRYEARYIGRDVVIYKRADGVPRGVIAFPESSVYGRKELLKNPVNALVLSKAQAAEPDTLATKLEAFSHKYLFLSLDITPLDADAGPVQAWLSQNSYYIGETPAANTIATDYVNCNLARFDYPEATATFGDSIRLESASVKWAEDRAQRYLCADLTWKALAPVDQSYHVALHIVGPDGKVVAQHDGIPMAGLAPTNLWTPGQPVIDRFAIRLPDDLPPGRYRMNVVVYAQDTGLRLPVSGGDTYLIGTFGMGGI